MREYIALDVHKRYTFAEKEDVVSGRIQHRRIEHNCGAIRSYLRGVESGTPVAVEATGNWYWIVEEIDPASADSVTAIVPANSPLARKLRGYQPNSKLLEMYEKSGRLHYFNM